MKAKARKASLREIGRVAKWFLLIGVPLTMALGLASYKPTAAIKDVPLPPGIVESVRTEDVQKKEKALSELNRKAPLGTVYYVDHGKLQKFELSPGVGISPTFTQTVLDKLLSENEKLQLSEIVKRTFEEKSVMTVMGSARQLSIYDQKDLDRIEAQAKKNAKFDFSPTLYTLTFSDKLTPYYGSKTKAEINQILSKSPIEKREKLAERYKDDPKNMRRVFGTSAGILAAYLLLAGAKNRAKSAHLERTSAERIRKNAEQLLIKGNGISARSLLKPHLGGFYAALLHRDEEIRSQLFNHLNPVTQKQLDKIIGPAGVRGTPSTQPELSKYLSECLLNGKPPLLYGFWGGVKESQSGVADEYDAAFLERLHSFSKLFEDAGFKSPRMKIIFADTHAQMNGADQKKIEDYYRSMLPLAKKHGVQLVRLSKLEKKKQWKEHKDWYARSSYTNTEKLVTDALSNDKVRNVLTVGAKRHWKKSEDISNAVKNYATKRVEEGLILSQLPEWRGIHFAVADPHVIGSLVRLPTICLKGIDEGNNAPWFLEGKPLKSERKQSFLERYRPRRSR